MTRNRHASPLARHNRPLRVAISQANAAPGADEIEFAVSLTGEININALDYLAFRDSLGTSISPDGSGADGSGTVDTSDFAFFVNNFGANLPQTDTLSASLDPTFATLPPLATDASAEATTPALAETRTESAADNDLLLLTALRSLEDPADTADPATTVEAEPTEEDNAAALELAISQL